MNLAVEGELPPGWTILGVAAVVKCWDDKGNVKFRPMYSSELNEAERRGMFDIATELMVEDLAEEYIVGDDDGEGPSDDD